MGGVLHCLIWDFEGSKRYLWYETTRLGTKLLAQKQGWLLVGCLSKLLISRSVKLNTKLSLKMISEYVILLRIFEATISNNPITNAESNRSPCVFRCSWYPITINPTL